MHRIDNSRFLLYIEPRKEEKSETPINDDIVDIMQQALLEAESGTSNYSEMNEPENFQSRSGFRGCHTTDCGERSDNKDYLLKNGMITNSLCVFYLKWYRNSIPPSEMDKVNDLIKFYKK